jgi:hypothetical protein
MALVNGREGKGESGHARGLGRGGDPVRERGGESGQLWAERRGRERRIPWGFSYFYFLFFFPDFIY